MQSEILKYERALEAFVVSLWKSADSHDTPAEWAHAYDELSAVERYLNQLHVSPARELAGDLKRLAGLRAEMSLPLRGRRDEERAGGLLGAAPFGVGG